jgi:hypothetical protein
MDPINIKLRERERETTPMGRYVDVFGPTTLNWSWSWQRTHRYTLAPDDLPVRYSSSVFILPTTLASCIASDLHAHQSGKDGSIEDRLRGFGLTYSR